MDRELSQSISEISVARITEKTPSAERISGIGVRVSLALQFHNTSPEFSPVHHSYIISGECQLVLLAELQCHTCQYYVVIAVHPSTTDHFLMNFRAPRDARVISMVEALECERKMGENLAFTSAKIISFSLGRVDMISSIFGIYSSMLSKMN